ncbi:MAG TPA: hypothetical protein VE982_02415 [Gaiellaceae bacterium]|nr:hypothetical protein [Gaiellaceae bacterium]
MRSAVLAVAVVAALVAAAAAAAAAAKDFRPGDVRACSATRCVAIRDQRVLNAISSFYYGPTAPKAAAPPATTAPYLELRFRNGYATGAVAGPRFDRFLSYGVNLDQFAKAHWYAVPPVAARALRALAARLHPQPLPANILARSH